MSDYVLITCEHGGNRIPAPYRLLFEGYGPLLDTHRGYDMGALAMARELAAAFAAPLIAGTVSRLLVDLNRSLGHPRLHGEAIRGVPADVRARIVERYYAPYRTNSRALRAPGGDGGSSGRAHFFAQLHPEAGRQSAKRRHRLAL